MRLRQIITLLILLTAVALPASAQDWRLVWSDEFETDGLPDPARWSYDVGGHGWGNNEAQYYTEAREENARVEDGVLVIEARREAFQGSDYTSARLVTKGKGDWRYGRVEVRADLPEGRGTWAAIWMLPSQSTYGNGGWPDNGEIDIMEYVGLQPDVIHGTVHTSLYNGLIATQRGGSVTRSDVEEAFHVYAVEWSPREIRFFVDDLLYFTFRDPGTGWEAWPFDRPFHLLLNLAVGGDWGGAQGIDDSIFPQQMAVDYVRVYRDAAAAPAVTITAPAADLSLETGASVTLSAEASDVSGQVRHLSLYQADGELGYFQAPPYTVTVGDLRPGVYALHARAVDDEGWEGASDTIRVVVGGADESTQAPYLMRAAEVPGTIQAEYYDLGGPGVAYTDLDPDNKGTGIRQGEGVDVWVTDDPRRLSYHVSDLSNREWLEYTVDVKEAGLYTVEVRVASTSGGAFRLEVDGVDKTGTMEFGETGGEQFWALATRADIELAAGVQVLRLRMLANAFSVDRMTFVRQTSTASEPAAVPRAFALLPNYPNPFNPSTTLAFELDAPSAVVLDVLDAAGRRVARLVDERRTAGRHEVAFDARALPSGTYFVRLVTPTHRAVLPVTLLK